MANAEFEQQSSHRRQNRFLLLLLVGAALVSTAKDIVRLHDFTSDLMALATSLHQTVNAAGASQTGVSCPETLGESDNSAQPFHWNGRVAPDQWVGLNSNGGIDAAPAVGAQLEVAFRKASLSEPAEPIQVAARDSELGLLALRPGEQSRRPQAADRSRHRAVNESVPGGVQNQDEQRDSMVRPPAIAFVSRSTNDEIRAWLRGHSHSRSVCPITISGLEAHSLNDRLRVASGYTQAMILNRQGHARLVVANCANGIELKTARGTISLDLLQLLKASKEAESLNGDAVPDVPRSRKRVIQRAIAVAPALTEDAH